MMVANGKSITRTYIGSEQHQVCELPNLIGVQLESYERFLQLERFKKGLAPDPSYGLEEVFLSTFPIDSPNGEMRLTYKGYTIDFENIKFSGGELKTDRDVDGYAVGTTFLLALRFGELDVLIINGIPLVGETHLAVGAVNGEGR